MYERRKAVEQLNEDFADLPDKEGAWNTLLSLTKDEDGWVRGFVSDAFVSAFPHIIDKDQAWNDLLAITKSDDRDVRLNVAGALVFAIPHVTDKEQVWNDLFQLTKNDDIIVQSQAINALDIVFPHLIDQGKAWNDLLELIKYINSDLIDNVAKTLVSVLPYVTDKDLSWNDLIELTKDDDSEVRWNFAEILNSAFIHVTNKKQAWNDLLTLTKFYDYEVRWRAVFALVSVFPHFTDKKQAWNDLLELSKDDGSGVHSNSSSVFCRTFPHIIDKNKAWDDLIELTRNDDSEVRKNSTSALGSIFSEFSEIIDKNRVLKPLIEIVKDDNSEVRRVARWSYFIIAQYFLKEKNYEQAYQCFYGASTKSTCWERLNLDSFYHLCHGLGYYYHGRTIVNELSNIDNPKEYNKSLEYAVKLFAKSIKDIEKSNNNEYDTRFFPICLNIFTAYYEYRLSFQKVDKKRVTKVQKYLDEASKQCKIIGTEKGERIVKIFEKLAEALISRLKELDLEAKKNKVSGIGEKAQYEPFIDKSRKAFEKQIAELVFSLDEIELPIIKEIAEHEKKKLDKLKPDKVENTKPINRKVLEIGALLISIATTVSGVAYTLFDRMEHTFALEESLVVFVLIFILILVFYSIEKK